MNKVAVVLLIFWACSAPPMFDRSDVRSGVSGKWIVLISLSGYNIADLLHFFKMGYYPKRTGAICLNDTKLLKNFDL